MRIAPRLFSVIGGLFKQRFGIADHVGVVAVGNPGFPRWNPYGRTSGLVRRFGSIILRRRKKEKGRAAFRSTPLLETKFAQPTWTGTYIRFASRWISSAIVLSVFFIRFFNCSTDFNGVSLNARITSPG